MGNFQTRHPLKSIKEAMIKDEYMDKLDIFLGTVTNCKANRLQVKLLLGCKEISWRIDTGTYVTVIPNHLHQQLEDKALHSISCQRPGLELRS